MEQLNPTAPHDHVRNRTGKRFRRRPTWEPMQTQARHAVINSPTDKRALRVHAAAPRRIGLAQAPLKVALSRHLYPSGIFASSRAAGNWEWWAR
jgi:hypothetical protein